MMRLATLATFFMGPLAAAWAAQDSASPWIETRFHRVHLRNGNTIDGQLVQDLRGVVVLQLKSGQMSIRRDMIDKVEMVRMRSLKEAIEFKAPPKAEPAVPEKPPVTETPERDKGPRPPTGADFASIPEDTRARIDEIIHGWMAAPSHLRDDLSAKLDDLSPEAARYLGLLLEERPRRVPTVPICRALGRRRDPASIGSLARVLESGPQQEREAAVLALIQIDAAECVPPILKALEDESPSVWRAASEGLVELDRKFPQARVTDTIASRVERVKEKTSFAMTLGALGNDDAYRALIYLVRSSDERDCLAGLQGIYKCFRPEDADYVMPSLRSRSPAIRKQACAVLGKAKYKPAVRDLIEMLGEEDVAIVADAHRALTDITGQTLARDINLWKAWWEVSGSKEK
jgi:hypothetical protein